MTLRCDVCRTRHAVVYQRHTGRRLCAECFANDILERVLQQIKKYKMIDPGDKIVIGLSGGKDSLTLFDIIAQIHDTSKIIAVTIIEGISEYNREEEIREAKRLTKIYGVEHIVVTLKDKLGYSVEEFMKLQENLESQISACTYCGMGRRRVLNSIARDLGADKVLTAHNLDDEVQTYIINVLRGDIARLVQVHPLNKVRNPRIVRKVKPLRKVYEYETTIYAYIKGFRLQDIECPYIELRPTLRAKVRELLEYMEWSYPGITMKILEFFDDILQPLVETYNRRTISLPLCELCGEPTSPGRRICKLCELIDRIKNQG